MLETPGKDISGTDSEVCGAVEASAGFSHRANSTAKNRKNSGVRKARFLWFKPVVFLLMLTPFGLLVYALLTNNLGPNPIEELEKQTGEWSLRILLLSLAMTPASQLFKVLWPIKVRRMVGLFAFFYVSVHLLVYVVFDQSLNAVDIVKDVLEKPFITIGFAGFLILVPLAVTSNRFMVRRLGSRWQALHRWVYIAALAGVIHFVWLAKGDRLEPIVYVSVLLILLAYRVVKMMR